MKNAGIPGPPIRSGVAAPPVYRPQTSVSQAKMAPPVYRPHVGTTQARPAPPVYRPQSTPAQAKLAPPVYRPQISASQARLAPPVYRPQSYASQAKLAPPVYKPGQLASPSGSAPPVYHPQPSASQAKLAPAYRPYNPAFTRQPILAGQKLQQAIQPKMPAPISAPVAMSQVGSHQRRPPSEPVILRTAPPQGAWGGSRTIQAMEAERPRKKKHKLPKGFSSFHPVEMLTVLAQPKVFKGPEIKVQNAIVKKLERICTADPAKNVFSEFCLGCIEFPPERPKSKTALMKQSRLVGGRNVALQDKFEWIQHDESLKLGIVINTIGAMWEAGQIDYLYASGLTGGESEILAEVHYVRDRPTSDEPKKKSFPIVATSNFHKDTQGDTAFVNLHYLTEHKIAGPEFVVNPLLLEEHEDLLAKTMSPIFLEHLKGVRANLGVPTEIGASVIPAGGVIAFVDEAMHHMTPHRGHRAVPAGRFRDYLENEFPEIYKKAAGPGGLSKSEYGPELQKLWQRWIEMAHSSEPMTKYDRVELEKAGLTRWQIELLLDEYDEHSSQTEKSAGFRQVSIPKPGAKAIIGPIRKPGAPPLTRQMSTWALEGKIPPGTTGKRSFFRTWVRVVPRYHWNENSAYHWAGAVVHLEDFEDSSGGWESL